MELFFAAHKRGCCGHQLGISNDVVTLDTNGSAFSLQIGGSPGYTSQLTDGGATRNLSVSNGLTIAQNGSLRFTGNSSTISAGSLSNAGSILIGPGATLNLTSQPGGITDVPMGSSFRLEGNFNDLSSGAGGFSKLTSIEGTALFYNGQTTTITPTAGVLTLSNTARVDVGNDSTLTINGNVDNSQFFLTSFKYASPTGSTVNVSGTFTNNAGGHLNLYGSADVANINQLDNFGAVAILPGATMNLVNQPQGGITNIVAGSSFYLGGTFMAGANNAFAPLTNVGGTLVLDNGQTTTSTPIAGTLTVGSTGYIEVMSGTTFNVNGSVVVNSGGIFSVNDPFPTTVNITGTLTNLGGQVNVVGPSAFLNVGSISNGGMLTLPEGSTVNLANGFYHLASGTLGEAIGANGYAIIAVNGGLVMLDGTLDVLLDPGFYPAIGSTYQFLTFNPGALSENVRLHPERHL